MLVFYSLIHSTLWAFWININIEKGLTNGQSRLCYSSVVLYGNRTVNVVFTCGSLVAVTVPWCKLITLFTKYRPKPIP